MRTEVKISLFKPEGFVDTHVIDTENRGAAVLVVFDKYRNDELKYLNFIQCKLVK